MVIYVQWQQVYCQGTVFGRIVKIRCCDDRKFYSATFIFLLLVVLTVKLLAR